MAEDHFPKGESDVKKFMCVLAVLFVCLSFVSDFVFATPPVKIRVDKHCWGGFGILEMRSDKNDVYEGSKVIGIPNHWSSYIDEKSEIKVFDAAGSILYAGKMDNSLVYLLLNGKQGTVIAFTRCSGDGEGYQEWVNEATVVLTGY